MAHSRACALLPLSVPLLGMAAVPADRGRIGWAAAVFGIALVLAGLTLRLDAAAATTPMLA